MTCCPSYVPSLGSCAASASLASQAAPSAAAAAISPRRLTWPAGWARSISSRPCPFTLPVITHLLNLADLGLLGGPSLFDWPPSVNEAWYIMMLGTRHKRPTHTRPYGRWQKSEGARLGGNRGGRSPCGLSRPVSSTGSAPAISTVHQPPWSA